MTQDQTHRLTVASYSDELIEALISDLRILNTDHPHNQKNQDSVALIKSALEQAK